MRRLFSSIPPAHLLLVIFCTTQCLSIVYPASIFALDPKKLLTQYKRESWNTQEGLPSNSVMSIVQGKNGYLWLGSFSGLARFDGTRFTAFNSANTPAITNNTFWVVLEDRAGTLWAGTNGGGLVRYANGIFTTYTTENGLSSNNIRSLCEDVMGNLWVGTVKGLCVLPHGDKVFQVCFLNLPTNVKNTSAKEVNGEPNVVALCADVQGRIWVGTEGSGLFCVMKSAIGTFQNAIQYVGAEQGLPSTIVNEVYEDSRHTLWIGTATGLYILSESANNQRQCLPVGKSLKNKIIRRVRQDKDGNYWVGTSTGLYRLRLTSGAIGQAQVDDGTGTNDALAHEFWAANFNTICEDREGNLWLGLYSNLGLNCLIDTKLAALATTEGLAGNFTYAIVDTHDSTVWMGFRGGITQYDRTSRRAINYNLDKNGNPEATANLVRTLLKDHTGTIWAGTYGAGVFKLNDGKFVSAYTTANGLAGDLVRFMYEDSRGALWVATRNGLTCIQNGVCTTYTTAQGLAYNSLMRMYEDRQHRLWIGTDGGGLSCWSNGTFTNFSVRNGLAADVIFCFYEEPDGTLWVGTNSGLTRFKNGRWTSMKAIDGLPNENIFQIMADTQGNVWIGSNAGIFKIAIRLLHECMDAKERGTNIPLQYLQYGRADGMPVMDCTVPALGCMTSDGVLWFPTIKGVVMINPEAIKTNTLPPPVMIESISLDGHMMSARPDFVIPPGVEQYTIDYAGLSYSAPEKVNFRYQLKGLDNAWTEAGTRRTAYYTHLPPGRYTFQVVACNNDGVWNLTGATMVFTIEPHFYQTMWFYGLCVVVLVGSSFGAYRVQVRRIQWRNELLKKLVDEQTMELQSANTELERANDDVQQKNIILSQQGAEIQITNTVLQEKNLELERLNLEKNEFLGIAVHDMRNPLAKITMSTSLIRHYLQEMTQEQLLERLQAIEDTARQMAGSITNLLDINRFESGKFSLNIEECSVNNVVQEMVENYAERAATKNIALSFQPSEHQLLIQTDKIVLREILDNLISNAVKYSPQGLSVFIAVHSEQLVSSSILTRISVRDEGQGLTDEDKSKLFDRFARLSAKPTGGEHSTGLGLSIVKKLVEALDGRVWCESESGKGATFIVELPLQPSSQPL